MVQVVTFGCRLNAFESEVIKEKLKAYDNLIVVNTCAVTGEAERQCRQAVRKLKKENPQAKIIVTGCSAQVHGNSFECMDEVDLVLGNQEKAHIEDYVSQIDGAGECRCCIASDCRHGEEEGHGPCPHALIVFSHLSLIFYYDVDVCRFEWGDAAQWLHPPFPSAKLDPIFVNLPFHP